MIDNGPAAFGKDMVPTSEEQQKKRILELKDARRVFVLTLGLNVLVALSKLIWGFMSNTLSMMADGFHSLLDAASNVVGIIGLTISSKPPDHDHPYGHRKFEALAAIAISFLMFLASYEVLSECIQRLLGRSAAVPVVSSLSYIIMAVTAVVNICVSRYEHKKGTELRSQLLLADAKHTLTDVYATAGVLASLVAIQFNFPVVDVIASVIIVGIIIKAGYAIIDSNLGSLVDAAMLDPKFIEELVLSVPGVSSCHKIRSRGMQDAIFIDLHVQVPKHLSIEQAHEISFQVEDKIRSAAGGVVDVLVHVEDDNPPQGQ